MMEDNSEKSSFMRKKKNKKSFLQKAKKFGKQGRLGRGKEVDRDTYDYFVRVLQNWKEIENDKESDKESKEMFIYNVFDQTLDKEVDLSCNQLVSRVIEILLPFSNDETRQRFMDALAKDLRIICTDPFASHVLEKLLMLNAFKSQGNASSQSSSEFLAFSKLWLTKVSKFIINNLTDFIHDTYASHLLRTCIQCLYGKVLPEDVLRSKRSRGQKSGPNGPGQTAGENLVPVHDSDENVEEFHKILEDIGNRVIELNQAYELVSSEVSCGVLQAVIIVIQHTNKKLCKKLCLHLLEMAFGDELNENNDYDDGIKKEEDKEEDNEPKNLVLTYFNSDSFARMLETMLILEETVPKIYKKVFTRFYEGNLCTLAQHPIGNFAVQKLLTNCKNKEAFEKWYSQEFDDNIERILSSGNTGVVLCLAQTCKRLNAKQAHFLVALMKSLHCYEPTQAQDKLGVLLTKMVTKEILDEATEDLPIHLHGSLIVQEILQFQKPIKMVSSLLSMDGGQLRQLLSDPRGSHITDAFMESATIGEKSREGLLKTLQGQLVALACNKHGSRSMDAIWKKSSFKSREIIAGELAQKEAVLNSNQFGKFIAQKSALSIFKRNKNDWKSTLENDSNKRKVLNEFITDMKIDRKKVKMDLKSDIPEHKTVAKTEESSDIKVEDTFDLVTVSKVKDKKKKKKKEKSKSYLDDL